jgi:hypothetical protein
VTNIVGRLGNFRQRLAKLRPQQREIPLDRTRAADQHMIRTGHPAFRQRLTRERAQPPLHAVADDSATDLLGNRIADPHRRLAIGAIAYQQDEAGQRRAPAAVRGQEVGAPGKSG